MIRRILPSEPRDVITRAHWARLIWVFSSLSADGTIVWDLVLRCPLSYCIWPTDAKKPLRRVQREKENLFVLFSYQDSFGTLRLKCMTRKETMEKLKCEGNRVLRLFSKQWADKEHFFGSNYRYIFVIVFSSFIWNSHLLTCTEEGWFTIPLNISFEPVF